jgi:hypothetical protein
MKSRHPSLDWIRKVLADRGLAEDETVAGGLQVPLVPRMVGDARAIGPTDPANADSATNNATNNTDNERGIIVPWPALTVAR